MSHVLVLLQGFVMIALLLGAMALTLYLVWWAVMVAVSYIPIVGKRHRHLEWERLNRGGSIPRPLTSESAPRENSAGFTHSGSHVSSQLVRQRQKRRRRKLPVFAGRGFLSSPEKDPLAVTYRVEVFVDDGVENARGTAQSNEARSVAEFFGDSATLLLENGHQWECIVVSKDGRLEHRGEAPVPQEH